jgi:hypothetical protein
MGRWQSRPGRYQRCLSVIMDYFSQRVPFGLVPASLVRSKIPLIVLDKREAVDVRFLALAVIPHLMIDLCLCQSGSRLAAFFPEPLEYSGAKSSLRS